MEKLQMCRICLAQNVRMYKVVNRNLHELYEKLTDIPFITEDSRPMLACFFCCTKLKKCYQLLRKCLKAEELFAHMMNEDYEPNTLINQDHLKIFSGFIKSPTENISIVDDVQIEIIAIKEELPAVCDELDNFIEPKEELQSDENISIVDECQTKSIYIKEELPAVCERLDDVIEPKEELHSDELEPKKNENSYLGVADMEPNHSFVTFDVPLIEYNTVVAKEIEVSSRIRRAMEMKRATVAKKPNLKTERTKLEDAITTEQMKKDKSDSKIIQTTQKRTSKPDTYFKEAYKCDQPRFNRVKKKIQHTRIQIGKQVYKCEVCQRSFCEKGKLTSHVRIHTGEKPYKCDVCQRSFSVKSNLTNHVRIHTGEKPYKCDVCQRSFSVKSNLSRHIVMHTGKKPYKCDVCQRGFSEKGHLTQHIRIHTGEKPYKCDVCQRSFSQKGVLTKHICAGRE